VFASVCAQSCEFWLAFCEAQIESELLKPFLPRLIPMLMKNMVSAAHGVQYMPSCMRVVMA
jgi:hypothetical protein